MGHDQDMPCNKLFDSCASFLRPSPVCNVRICSEAGAPPYAPSGFSINSSVNNDLPMNPGHTNPDPSAVHPAFFMQSHSFLTQNRTSSPAARASSGLSWPRWSSVSTWMSMLRCYPVSW